MGKFIVQLEDKFIIWSTVVDGLPRCGPKCPAIFDKHGCEGFCPRCWGTDYVREP